MRPTLLRLCTAMAALMLSLTLTAQALPNPVQPYRKLSPGPARTVTGATLAVGSARLTFTGAWAPLLCEGKPVGLFLDGQGTLEYRSGFLAEEPVFARNLKTWSGLTPVKTPQGLTVSLPFKSARILWVGQAPPPWQGQPAPALEADLAGFQDRFQRLELHSPGPKLALQAANAPDRPLAIMELEQGKTRWIYTYDGFDRLEETLAWVEPIQKAQALEDGHLSLERVSWQPLGWDPRKDAGPVPFQVLDLDLDLRTQDQLQAQVVVKETLLAGMDGIRIMDFGLMHPRLTDQGLLRLEVARVTDGDGRDLAFDQDWNHLTVRLASPTRTGQRFTLTFQYGGRFLYHPGGNNLWELAVGGDWHPSLPYAAGEFCTFHGTVRTGGDWLAFLPGETVRRGRDGDWNLVETRSTRPLNNLTVVGGKYFTSEDTRDGLTVRIATYAFKPGVAKTVLLDQAFNMVKFYQGFLGPFPFKEFQIVQKPEWGHGQAPPGMMYITREAFEQLSYHQRAVQSATTEAEYFAGAGTPGLPSVAKTWDIRKVFAHEIAHQYWGTVVKPAAFTDYWLNEAFAEYSAALYLRTAKGKSYFDSEIGGFFTRAAMAAAAAPIPLVPLLNPRDGFEHFSMGQNLLYSKGPALLSALHRDLGEEVFLTWIKSIQSNFRWKFASSRRVFDLLEFIAKRDFKPFQEKYFWGLELPAKGLPK